MNFKMPERLLRAMMVYVRSRPYPIQWNKKTVFDYLEYMTKNRRRMRTDRTDTLFSILEMSAEARWN